MEFSSPPRTERVRDIEVTFVDGATIGFVLKPEQQPLAFVWGTRYVLTDGRTIDVHHANALYVINYAEREQTVVERTPSGLPATVVDIVNRKPHGV